MRRRSQFGQVYCTLICHKVPSRVEKSEGQANGLAKLLVSFHLVCCEYWFVTAHLHFVRTSVLGQGKLYMLPK
jgi:hypothetical protein